MEIWEYVHGFPGYVINNRGIIINDRTHQPVAQCPNQSRVVMVGLTREKVQYKRAVSVLVADHFLPRPPSTRFNTIIHLDGNPEHNFVENLAWRPRAFAIAYHSQLRYGYPNRIEEDIAMVETGEIFPDTLVPTKKFGVLERSVVNSVLNMGRDEVFPIHRSFCYLNHLDTIMQSKRGL